VPTAEELEDRAAREAVAGLKARLEALVARSLPLYESLDTDARRTFRGMVAASLEALDTSDVTAPISKASGEAVRLGMAEAARRGRVPVPNRLVLPSPEAMSAAVNAARNAQEELQKAARRVREVESPDDLQDALTGARRAVSRTEAAARFAVNRSLSDGVRAVAEEHQWSRIWLPERDACVHCLAYAGEVAGPGEAFRGGLTFGEKPLVPASGMVPDAPLHPNCRCRTRIYIVGTDSPDEPDALKREALRSVLRGWSLPSESERTRLKAAEKALARLDRPMPKSVQDYARRALKRGSFDRGRAFPTPDRKAVAPARRRSATREVSTEPEPRPAPGGVVVDPLRGLPVKSGEIRTATRPYLDPDYADMVFGWDTRDGERNSDVRFTNPHFDEGREWQVNCQRVAVAYELRRRGYLVEALPNVKGRDKQYASHDLENVWREPSKWIRPDGTEVAEGTPGAVRIGGGVRRFARPGSSLALKAQVSTWPPGSRGWIVAAWKAGGAHIWNVEVAADGTVIYLDAQLRTVLKDGQPHFRNAIPSSLLLLRVDDLVPTEEIPTMVQPPT